MITPFSLLADVSIRPIIKKKLMGQAYVELGLLLAVSQSLFETGVIAARLFSDRLDVLMKLFSAAGTESNVLNVLQQAAIERLRNVGDDVNSFFELFLCTEMMKAGLPEDWVGSDMVRIGKLRVAVPDAFTKIQLYGSEGIGFGSIFPEIAQSLLENSVKPIDSGEWHKWRVAGLNVSPRPPTGTLPQREEMVRGIFQEFVHSYRPELVEPLGLLARITKSKRTVNILLSNSGGDFEEIFSNWMRDAAPEEVHLNIVTPITIAESELMRTAGEHFFDLAVITMNNVKYTSPGRSATDLQRHSVNLIKIFTEEIGVPVIALFGYPREPSYRAALLTAGAAAVCPLPCKREMFESAFKSVVATQS